jgi:hypothetical protein
MMPLARYEQNSLVKIFSPGCFVSKGYCLISISAYQVISGSALFTSSQASIFCRQAAY